MSTQCQTQRGSVFIESKLGNPSKNTFLASPDALEVMLVTDSLSHSLSISTGLADVTLVSNDTY